MSLAMTETASYRCVGSEVKDSSARWSVSMISAADANSLESGSEMPIDQSREAKGGEDKNGEKHCAGPVEAVKTDKIGNDRDCKHPEHDQIQHQPDEHGPERLVFQRTTLPASIHQLE